jgi:hypothetical protein
VAGEPKPPIGQWGRVREPAWRAGAYVLVEVESPEGWKQPPPDDAIRVWQRRPGVADDHDDNWTMWLHRHQLASHFADVVIEEWLPEGAEPDWTR